MINLRTLIRNTAVIAIEEVARRFTCLPCFPVAQYLPG